MLLSRQLIGNSSCSALSQWWSAYAYDARCALVFLSDEFFRSESCCAELGFLKHLDMHIIPIKMAAYTLPQEFKDVIFDHIPRTDPASADAFDPESADHMGALCDELDRHDLRPEDAA